MGAIASQITSPTIVYSTVYSAADQRKHQSPCVTGLCAGNSPETGEFPAQMVSNAENVSIWWRHHIKSSYGYMQIGNDVSCLLVNGMLLSQDIPA